MHINSWGNLFPTTPDNYQQPAWQDEIKIDKTHPQLTCGLRRSYGDVCLIKHGKLIDYSNINRVIHFDTKNGIFTAEAGISIKTILDIIIPKGWIFPVLPGTQFVTLGGAIANDVHGKNHHSAGSFGCHVKNFKLKRSDQADQSAQPGQSGQISELLCSTENNPELFNATIGGLGLTGLITEATIELKPIASEYLEVETLVFNNLTEFLEINAQSELDYEYTVAWLDCVAKNENFSRGIYMRANFAKNPEINTNNKKTNKPISIPCFMPGFLLNKFSIGLFNKFYFYIQSRKANQSKQSKQLQHYSSFFFPLDNILHWNRIYGKKGFYQYQFVLPKNKNNPEMAHNAMEEILKLITQSGMGSFLSVLKTFGEKKSPGLLSFPEEGLTLALDFANKNQASLDLFKKLNQIILKHHGKIYPAKDAQMPAELFHASYQKPLEKFINHIDPQFSSIFWERIK